MNANIRRDWTNTLYRSLEGCSTAAIHVASALTNIGREDGKVVGSAAATLAVNPQLGRDTQWVWTYGEECMKFDASCFGIAKAVEALTCLYASVVAPDTIYIFCSDWSALTATSDPILRAAHKAALLFNSSLTSFCNAHENTLIILAWTPVDFTLERHQTTCELATEACQRDPPSGLRRVQSAAKQKDSARKEAVENWAQDWQEKRREREAGGRPRSFAHKHTITQPPNGGSHALWQAATQRAKDSKGNKTRKFRFNRRTTSTAIQVAVDHAFTGTYVDRFRPNDPPEARECPCGYQTRSSLHIIHSCTRFNAARCQARISYRRATCSPTPKPDHGKRSPRNLTEEMS
ncbi:hypothetical protein EDB89DRAFT_1909283 [Lactarius sanguifluus]|nr:hypothetical protein EDB89DRAFT_1909283 [Lactarius sanguifluus]